MGWITFTPTFTLAINIHTSQLVNAFVDTGYRAPQTPCPVMIILTIPNANNKPNEFTYKRHSLHMSENILNHPLQ